MKKLFVFFGTLLVCSSGFSFAADDARTDAVDFGAVVKTVAQKMPKSEQVVLAYTCRPLFQAFETGALDYERLEPDDQQAFLWSVLPYVDDNTYMKLVGHRPFFFFGYEQGGKAMPGFVEKNPRSTLLHRAAECGRSALVEYMINHTPSGNRSDFINAQNEHGKTALHVTAYENKSAVCATLYNYEDTNGTLQDICGVSPLHAAAGKGHLDVVRVFVEKQPRWTDQSSRNGNTPLRHAISGGASAVAHYLLENGADPRRTDPSLHQNALHAAVAYRKIDVARALTAGEHKKELMDMTDINGRTPLALARYMDGQSSRCQGQHDYGYYKCASILQGRDTWTDEIRARVMSFKPRTRIFGAVTGTSALLAATAHQLYKHTTVWQKITGACGSLFSRLPRLHMPVMVATWFGRIHVPLWRR